MSSPIVQRKKRSSIKLWGSIFIVASIFALITVLLINFVSAKEVTHTPVSIDTRSQLDNEAILMKIQANDLKKAKIAAQLQADKEREIARKKAEVEAQRIAESERIAQEEKAAEAKRIAEVEKAAEAEQITAENLALEQQNEQETAPPVEKINSLPAPELTSVPPVAAPTTTQINVGIAGDQSVVDSCQGPVLYSLAGLYTYVAEHDSCGGWARFGSLSMGQKVTMTGLVSGTYSVGNIIEVPQGATSDSLAPLGNVSVVLQTCIPGTTMMRVVGLY